MENSESVYEWIEETLKRLREWMEEKGEGIETFLMREQEGKKRQQRGWKKRNREKRKIEDQEIKKNGERKKLIKSISKKCPFSVPRFLKPFFMPNGYL